MPIRIAVSLFVALIALALPGAAAAEHSKLELITTGDGPGAFFDGSLLQGVCTTVKAEPARMWPVTNRLHAVVLGGATDPDGDPVSIGITGVTQDEPVGQEADAVLQPGRRSAVRIRAERHPARDGRVHRIAFDAVDDSGGTCEGMATVSVRRQRHIPARDSFPHSWNSIR